MQSFSKFVSSIAFLLFMGTLLGSLLAQDLSFGPIFIDGNISEWNLNNDYYADLYESSNDKKDVLGKLYLRYDVSLSVMNALYLPINDSPVLIEDGKSVYVKAHSSRTEKEVSSDDEGNGVAPDFQWIEKGFDGNNDHARGWEASFEMEEGDIWIEVESSVWNSNKWDKCGAKKIDVTINSAGSEINSNLEGIEYGDAPESYGIAKHGINAATVIGDFVDSDDESHFSYNADGDDENDGVDDEEGVEFLSGIEWEVGTQVQVRVNVTNTSDRDVQLAAWIDLDGNGTFDSDERIIGDDKPDAGNDLFSKSGTVTYNFKIPQDAYTGQTFIRFRLDTRSDIIPPCDPIVMAAPSITGGEGDSGETEDYPITLYGDPIAVNLSSFDAFVNENLVKLSWCVENEINHAGYNVYRSDKKDRGFVKLNDQLVTNKDIVETAHTQTYEFEDMPENSGTFYYKLEEISLDGESTFFGPISVPYFITTRIFGEETTLHSFVLSQNYPNPFNPVTTIEYELSAANYAELIIYNMVGERVRILIAQNQAAGKYSVVWDGKDDLGLLVPTGQYLYKLLAGEQTSTKIMTLIR